jgi:undecaprenyl phosphate N,N'-diacetylbacillosamine 1-phosphate transferase
LLSALWFQLCGFSFQLLTFNFLLLTFNFSISYPLYSTLIKPFFDKLSALIVLLISSPVLLLVVLLLATANRGKVWFVQPRPGKGEKIFYVIKFKTMNDARNEKGELLSDEERLTWIGNLVRKTSLDELPQLINVLKGDMSLVGPRPLLVEYLPLYNEVQRKRHDVTPGITGWAQVNGRNAISWEQKFEYDVWYVAHQSFWLDVKILFLTVFKVFKAEGISSATSMTMEKFKGN